MLTFAVAFVEPDTSLRHLTSYRSIHARITYGFAMHNLSALTEYRELLHVTPLALGRCKGFPPTFQDLP